MTKLYKLNEGDRAIFATVTQEPNYFTDFYMRGDMTGTWWRPPGETIEFPDYLDFGVLEKLRQIVERWVRGYEILNKAWVTNGRPEEFDHNNRHYFVIYESDIDRPSFHDHHGTIFLPWWREAYFARQTTRVIIGGYGSSKTWFEMVRNLINMATKRYYRCFVIAPFSIQANEVLTQARMLLTGTEYQRRFMPEGGLSSKPFPKITVRNDLCIESTMEFYSIDKNADKLLNLSGDSFHVEQAEQIPDLEWLFEIMGGRLRGQVAGREREGIITLIANSDEAGNPQLWDYYDEQITDPDSTFSISPPTWDNPFITPRQLKDIIKRMGRNPENVRRALEGSRPIGSGEHFSAASIQKCRSEELDEMMLAGLRAHNPDYKLLSVPKAQVVEWALPPRDDRIYLLAADPGWGNPPKRNSAVLMVFDITNFPDVPASLVAFCWVYGNNSPDPWILKYMDWCQHYKCINRNVFDSTGPQSGYSHLVHGLSDLNPWALNLGASKKFTYLNTAKTLMARGKFAFPNIPMLFNQLSNYKLPDDKLRQDIVMCLVAASAYLDYLFYEESEDRDAVALIKRERYDYHSRGGLHEVR